VERKPVSPGVLAGRLPFANKEVRIAEPRQELTNLEAWRSFGPGLTEAAAVFSPY
jgi:hypothetical protein